MVFDEGGRQRSEKGCQPAIVSFHVRPLQRQTKGLFWGEKRMNSADCGPRNGIACLPAASGRAAKIPLAGGELTR
jgi:hypothetical protein